jgi:Ca2+/Na+ antiporter
MFSAFAIVVYSLLSLASMSLTFFAMCTVCDNHLVPAIEVFIDQFNLPEDIAGVTFVAFGSASPELLLNILSGAAGTSALSLSALLGSSLIAFGLIPPLCIILTPHDEIKLEAWPILRESVFYMIGLIVFVFSVQDGELTAKEAGISVSVYVIYVLLIVISFVMNPNKSTHKEEASTETINSENASIACASVNDNMEDRKLLLECSEQDARRAFSLEVPVNSYNDAERGTRSGWKAESLAIEGEDVEAVVRVPRGWKQTTVNCSRTCMRNLWTRTAPLAQPLLESIAAPIILVIKMTIPNLPDSTLEINAAAGSRGNRRVSFVRAFAVFSMSILWIAVLAWCLIGVSESLIKLLNVGTSTIGATLLALGSEIPDALASVALARSGYNDGSMSGAIGSQVINITLSAAIPTLLTCWLTGKSIKFEVHQTRSFWLLLSLVVVIFLGYTLFTMTISTVSASVCSLGKSNLRTHVRRQGAWKLLCLFLLAITAFIWLNEEVVMDEMIDEMNDTNANKLNSG